MPYRTDNLRISETREVIAPEALSREIPTSERAAGTVHHARRMVADVIHGRDRRLLVITGPCSIHDPEAARDYAGRLKPLINRHHDALVVLMRVYFEKPRTTVGWKGLINDPRMDGSFRINDGLRAARRLLVDLNEMGVPAATEFLDPITPQYLAELVSWGAIGARTTESQVHRELASGLSCPVGFKNATNGGVQVAIDAVRSASHPHHFLGVTKSGHSAIVATTGNPDCHVILRGGHRGPNYGAQALDAVARKMQAAGLPARVIVDASHANSGKDPERQREVALELAAAVAAGDERIMGVMLESHLVAGRQDIRPGEPLRYGQSVTDACMGWEATEEVIGALADAARARRGAARAAG